MSKVSFTKPGTPEPSPADISVPSVTTAVAADGTQTTVVDATPVSEIPTSPVGTAVVPANPQLPAAPEAPTAFNDDDIGFEDIILPRLNIVQKVGDLSNVFTPGEIVLNQSLVIHTPANPQKTPPSAGDPPLSVTVIGFRKRQFVEKTTGGALGKMFNSEAEVVKAGGTLDYKESTSTGKTLYQRLATALVLVQKPAHVKDDDRILFPHECEGQWYALALWSMKGTAYTNAAKVIYTARKLGHLKAGYPRQAWALTTKLEKYSENFAYIPVIKPGAKNTEAFGQFVLDVLNSGN